MQADFHDAESMPLSSNVTASRVVTNADGWRDAANAMHQAGAGLLTLWGSDDRDRDQRMRIHAAYLLADGVTVVEHALPAASSAYPSLASQFPVAARLQRATYDLLGIRAEGGDHRSWLRHDGWPAGFFPLRREVDPVGPGPVPGSAYPFVQVSGDGVHEVAVGPVHAGIIEPGRFVVSLVGEKVLRLEERLGYTHKGVAKRFEALPQTDGHRLASRLCGDSAVAYAWAWCAALESVATVTPPARGLALRALALERERIANHLGDLGAIANDAGLAFGQTQFSALKEQLLRSNAALFGQRYLFDFVLPGGVACDLAQDALSAALDDLSALERATRELRRIYDDHEGLQDRFHGTGRLTREQAARMGAVGLAARACGIRCDLRVDQPWAPYDRLAPVAMVHPNGDVASRVEVRFDETLESLRLCREILQTLPSGAIAIECPPAPAGRLGLGLIEGWRGPVAMVLETGQDKGIRRCHAHDASWQNWPLIELALLGNILPDFPLINKSFNLAYSGHDG